MCLVPDPSGPCVDQPRKTCRCGLWALSDPVDCLQRARNETMGGMPGRPRPAMGLMQGWGITAVHGREGFRAQ